MNNRVLNTYQTSCSVLSWTGLSQLENGAIIALSPKGFLYKLLISFSEDMTFEVICSFLSTVSLPGTNYHSIATSPATNLTYVYRDGTSGGLFQVNVDTGAFGLSINIPRNCLSFVFNSTGTLFCWVSPDIDPINAGLSFCVHIRNEQCFYDALNFFAQQDCML